MATNLLAMASNLTRMAGKMRKMDSMALYGEHLPPWEDDSWDGFCICDAFVIFLHKHVVHLGEEA